MKKLLLNLYFWPVFICITLFGVALVPFIIFVSVIFLGRSLPKTLRLIIRIYGWILVCVVPFMAPVEVLGDVKKIPRPSIIVANHTSAIDPYLFGAIPLENCFVTSWPFKIPVYRPFMKLAGYINTSSGWEAIRKQCKKMLNENVCITIWPEGHRSRTGNMGRFRRGAFQLSVETGFPIQPVCILGSRGIMAPGKKMLSPGQVKLVLLAPIYPDKTEHDSQIAITNLRCKTVSVIQETLQQNYNSSSEIIVGSSPNNESVNHPLNPRVS